MSVKSTVLASTKALIFTVLLAVLSVGVAQANMKTVTDEQITVSTSAIGLTTAKYTVDPRVVAASCYVSGANIRWRASGSDPDTDTGRVAESGTTLVIPLRDMADIRFIRDDSTDATLDCDYFIN